MAECQLETLYVASRVRIEGPGGHGKVQGSLSLLRVVGVWNDHLPFLILKKMAFFRAAIGIHATAAHNSSSRQVGQSVTVLH
jgi:hypothetical protein